jgi:DNA-binding MarR family transcriptional regulator
MTLNDDYQAYDRLSDELFRAHRQRVERLLHQSGLTMSQALTLRLLADRGEVKMSDLAHHMDLSPGAVTGMVERMVDHGHVVRRRDLSDRRAVWISLTEAGQALYGRLREAKQTLNRSLFELLAPPDRQTLLSGMASLLEASQRLDGSTYRS